MTEVPSSAHEPRQVAEINKSSTIEHCFKKRHTKITPVSELYKYRADLEKLLDYRTNAADSHQINAFSPLYYKKVYISESELITTKVPSYMGTEFDIFAPKPRQIAVEGTFETIYKPIVSIDQTDIEFLISGDSETHIDLDLKQYIKRQLLKEDNTELGDTAYTTGINSLLPSLFSQCSISLNGTQITQGTDLYNYRAYLETLINYGSDAADRTLKMLSGTWIQVT